MEKLIREWESKAKSTKKENRLFLKKAKGKTKEKINALATELHEEVFEEIDCLKCANCCRGLGPRLNRTDIKRMAKHLRMKDADFEDEYVKIDEDGDSVMKAMPCPFLGDDNYCSIYEVRPRACREYPHTDMDNFISKSTLHIRNTTECPAVYHVLERIKKAIRT
ncbi:MAG: YkgJ family cysteine cluster protein [Saprospiraceae bacterium]